MSIAGSRRGKFGVDVWPPFGDRWKAAVNCLLGRPTMFRIKVKAGTVMAHKPGTLITYCEFSGLGETYNGSVSVKSGVKL